MPGRQFTQALPRTSCELNLPRVSPVGHPCDVRLAGSRQPPVPRLRGGRM